MIQSPQTVLCFDIGLKRTGVATGNTLTQKATPAGRLSVAAGKLNWQELDKLITKWEPKTIIIGDPQTTDPAFKKVINRFKSHIQQTHKLPIIEVDERLTSSAANEELEGRGLSLQRKTELRDQIAACLILETYFNTYLTNN